MNFISLFSLCSLVLFCGKKTTPSAKEVKILDTTNSVKLSKDFETKKREDTISASEFGVKADYNGKTGTDNRQALQLAIDYCAKNKKKLKLPSGRILLNSFGVTTAAKAHGNILELKSDTHIIGANSEIVIGSSFKDKSFIVLSGFNSANPLDFTAIYNVSLKNITLDFNSKQVYMENDYRLAKGIELGHCVNAEISNNIFKNGDISCALGTGYGSKNISRNILIMKNKFVDLIATEKNIDHTTVYINSSNSVVKDNIFINNSIQGKLVACATEFHNSDNIYTGNIINGYTRMMFLASTLSENKIVKNLTIKNNNAQITNAAIYPWVEKNCRLENVLIQDNVFTSEHVKGYGMLYNGTQGILADAKDEKNAVLQNFVIKNNTTKILYTAFAGRAVNFSTKATFKNENNICIGCKDGTYYIK